MDYTQLGSTDLVVSAVALGTAVDRCEDVVLNHLDRNGQVPPPALGCGRRHGETPRRPGSRAGGAPPAGAAAQQRSWVSGLTENNLRDQAIIDPTRLWLLFGLSG